MITVLLIVKLIIKTQLINNYEIQIETSYMHIVLLKSSGAS